LQREKKILTAVNYNYRFYPFIQHARSMVESKELGDIYYVHGNYLQDWLYYDTDYNWRLESKLSGSSRAIADIGTHWCDLIQFLTGKK
jgi:predicted dehydrogenase